MKVASHLQKNADMKGRIQQYLYLNQADYSKGKRQFTLSPGVPVEVFLI